MDRKRGVAAFVMFDYVSSTDPCFTNMDQFPKEIVMYCHDCGTLNPAGAQFCQECYTTFAQAQVALDAQRIIELAAAVDYVDKNRAPYPYVISMWKLLVLSTLTLGFFNMYWFYRQWKSFCAVWNERHSTGYL